MTRKKQIYEAALEAIRKGKHQEYEVDQFAHLHIAVAERLHQRPDPGRDGKLEEEDRAILEEVFWDLILNRKISLAYDLGDPESRFFRVHSSVAKVA